MLEKYKNYNSEDPKKKRIYIRLFLYGLSVVLFLGIALFTWQYYVKNIQNKKVESNLSGEKITTENDTVQKMVQDFAGDENKKSSEEKLNNIDNMGAVSSSENYRINQIRFGSGVILSKDEGRKLPLKVYDVKSEIVSSQEDGEPRFLITWRTNKEAISDIIYSKNDGSNTKTITEEGYGFEHSVLLKNMDFATIYIYKVKSNDRWGNKVSTEYFSAYTGEKSESIFDLIFNAVQDVFGWAMNK